MKKIILLTSIIAAGSIFSAQAEDKTSTKCPDFLNHDFKKLHSSDTVNLCKSYTGKPILFVNTASHCGFTPQFKALESLSEKYKGKGLQVVGFASNDFNQEAKSEEKAATICYENFGVTFTMLAPTHVKGKDANAVFAYLGEKTQAPAWNFNKYLLTENGNKVTHYESKIKPLESKLESDVKAQLN